VGFHSHSICAETQQEYPPAFDSATETSYGEPLYAYQKCGREDPAALSPALAG